MPLLGDVNGDGKTEFVRVRREADGTMRWHVSISRGGSTHGIHYWGSDGAVPLLGAVNGS
ncbi:MAG TPA: hypothetical protein VF062_05185 [Candidatus Limnocylindrales bacterium]